MQNFAAQAVVVVVEGFAAAPAPNSLVAIGIVLEQLVVAGIDRLRSRRRRRVLDLR